MFAKWRTINIKGEKIMMTSGLIRLYCPNCGKKNVGYKRQDSAVHIQCENCLAKIYSKQKNKSEIDIKVKDLR